MTLTNNAILSTVCANLTDWLSGFVWQRAAVAVRESILYIHYYFYSKREKQDVPSDCSAADLELCWEACVPKAV